MRSDLRGHDRVISAVVDGQPTRAETAQVSDSWQRSAIEYGLDPFGNRAPLILSQRELALRREPLGTMLADAREEMDRLHALVREAGYVVLLCDTTGIAIDHRGDEQRSAQFREWGIWLGGAWSETTEGTNGIGTCIVEQRPVTVHRGQHFRWRHAQLSCSGAPIFGVDGRLIAVLDVSSFDPVTSEHAHALTGPLTQAAARAVEERLFRANFRRDWVIALQTEQQAALLAVDGDQRVLAADRGAREVFGIDDRMIENRVGLWTLFERDPGFMRWKGSDDLTVGLIGARDDALYPALVTPPAQLRAGTSELDAHTRPRRGMQTVLRDWQAPDKSAGGLSMRALRRLEDYVDANLDSGLDLGKLAQVAGMSKFYFARQFKQATGMTPGRYVTARRVERARALLQSTDLPLSTIAQMSGFADQSHFVRQFQALIGTTPGRYREALANGGI